MQRMQQKGNDLNDSTTTAFFSKKSQNFKKEPKHILAFERQKRIVIVVLVITQTLYMSLGR